MFTKKISLLKIFAVMGCLGITLFFVCQATTQAQFKSFWTDETFALETVEHLPFSTMIFKGLPGQGSPAPLDYILLKSSFLFQDSLNSGRLSLTIYYRLHTIFITALAGFLTMLILLRSLKPSNSQPLVRIVQIILLLAALITFYFSFYNFYYAIETRPYALWNALWFSFLLLFCHYQKFNKVIILLLVLLSLTASAALYQHAALIFSFTVFSFFIEKRRIKTIFVNNFKIFLLPLFITFYYVMIRSLDFTWTDTDKYLFYEWWFSKMVFPVLSFCGIVLSLLSEKYKKCAIVFGAMFVLFGIAPVINEISYMKGFFFSPRHYIYNNLNIPLFLGFLALAGPELWCLYRKNVKKYFWIPLFVFIGIAGILTQFYSHQKKYHELMLKHYRNRIYYLFRPYKSVDVIHKAKIEYNVFYYNLMAQRNPEDAAAQGLLGYSHYLLGKVDKSINYYQKALALQPDFIFYNYNLGVLSYQQGRFEDAEVYLKKTLVENRYRNIIDFSETYYTVLKADEELNGGSIVRNVEYMRMNTFRLLAHMYYENKRLEDIINLAQNPVFDDIRDSDFFKDLKKLLYFRSQIITNPEDKKLKRFYQKAKESLFVNNTKITPQIF